MMTEDTAKAPQTGEPEAAQTEEEVKTEKEPQCKENTGHKGSEKQSHAQHREAEAQRAENEKLKKELTEEQERYKRIYAEYENFRRRSQKERDGAYSDAVADVLGQVVPMIDNLERAVQSGASDKLLDGVNMILTQFQETLDKMGVEAFGAEGDPFDPALHHAIMHEEDAEKPENTVAAVFQKGYRKGERVIRFAMVKVVN